MFKYRLTMARSIDFISHLDFQRMLGRAVRRAELPVKFSEGFNPHMLISAVLPLPLGMTAESDVVYIVMTRVIHDIKERLNRVLPDGFTVLDAALGVLPPVTSALYHTQPERMPDDAVLRDFLARPHIVMPKKTKRGTNDTDIRPMILDISKNSGLAMTLAAGETNLKPSLVYDAMNRYIDGYDCGRVVYCRKAIY